MVDNPGIGEAPAFRLSASEPSNVARCYGFAFSADGALALKDDNEGVAVGGKIPGDRGA